MDPPKATFVSLAAMAEWLQPLQGTATAWRAEVPCSGCCRLADRILAHVRHPAVQQALSNPYFDGLGLVRLYVPAQA
jgi:hypothetical protein